MSKKTPAEIFAAALTDAKAADPEIAATVGNLMINMLHEAGYKVVSNDPAAIHPDATEELRAAAKMIRTWIPEVFPSDSLGRMHFVRVVMESVAANIEWALGGLKPVVGNKGDE
jgi:hypothetical protein